MRISAVFSGWAKEGMPSIDLHHQYLHPVAVRGETYQELRTTSRWCLVVLPHISGSTTLRLQTFDASSPEQHGSNTFIRSAKFRRRSMEPTFGQDTCHFASLNKKRRIERPWHRNQSPRSAVAGQDVRSHRQACHSGLAACSLRLGGDPHKVSSNPWTKAPEAFL